MKSAITHAAAAAALALSGAGAQASVFYFHASLDTVQVVTEVPIVSMGSAAANVELDTDVFTVTTDLAWSGLTGPTDGSHLHSGPEGTPSDGIFFHEVLNGVLQDCPWGQGNHMFRCLPAQGVSHDVLELTADNGYGYATFGDLVDAFQRGDIYIDLHTGGYIPGELRGQLFEVTSPQPIPEPSTTALLACAAAVGALMSRRRKR
jgi:hypothetical protein